MSEPRIVPLDAVPPRYKADQGKYARIMAKLIDLAPNTAYEYSVADTKQGHHFVAKLRKIAAKEGLELGWSRSTDGTLFYFWVVKGAK